MSWSSPYRQGCAEFGWLLLKTSTELEVCCVACPAVISVIFSQANFCGPLMS